MGSDHVSKLNDYKDKYCKAEQSLLSEKNWKKSLIVLGIVVVLVFVWNLQLISSGILARAKSAEPEKTVTQNDGGQADNYRPEDTKPIEPEEEKSAVSEADFVGTYVGADGSVLVIYPEHVADYYFKDWDHIEEDDAWKYADGRITISSPEIGCDFYAEAKDGQTEELLFTSDTLFKWKDEKYSKSDTSAKKLTLEEARATIEKKLGVTLEPMKTDETVVADASEDHSADKEDEKAVSTEEVSKAISDAVIRPEIKEAIDSYEIFMDKYCEFMKNYDASDMSALTTYLSMMEQYSDTMEKFDALEADLTDAETAYYTEVQLRVSQKLLKVIQ